MAETCSCCHNWHNKSCALAVAFPSLCILQTQRKWLILNLNNAIFAESGLFFCHKHLCTYTRALSHSHTHMQIGWNMHIFLSTKISVSHVESLWVWPAVNSTVEQQLNNWHTHTHTRTRTRTHTHIGANVVLTLFKTLTPAPDIADLATGHTWIRDKFLFN
jgi:hypothetical protein